MSVEIETMARGPAKVTVRVDDDDPNVAAFEAFELYRKLVKQLAKFEEGTS